MFGDFLENDIIKFSILRKYLSPRIKKILDIYSKNAKTCKLHSFSKKWVGPSKKSKYGACPEEKETNYSLICGIIRNK